MVLRAPIYFSAPSFWAEEGTLYFGLAWTHPVHEALGYRPAGYLLLCANLATTVAAALVHGGAVPLARAPLVTVLASLGVQLLPVAVIAWSRAPFWDGALRRSLGVAVVLFGALTDEIWLNTINCQPWLVVATALLLLEPVDARSGGWLPAGAAAPRRPVGAGGQRARPALRVARLARADDPVGGRRPRCSRRARSCRSLSLVRGPRRRCAATAHGGSRSRRLRRHGVGAHAHRAGARDRRGAGCVGARCGTSPACRSAARCCSRWPRSDRVARARTARGGAASR